jgi:replicative DNA helicase
MTPRYVTASTVAASEAFDPDAPPPPRYDPGRPFQSLDLRPGRVILLGAPPGAGKTALALQVTVGVLQHHADLKAVVANVEMAPADLLARVVARLAGVPASHIADKTFAPGEKERVRVALGLHRPVMDRMAFLDPPFSLDHLAAVADSFKATLLVIDYVQRFGRDKDLRENLDGIMTGVRRLALAGAAVLAVSSIARQRDDRGRSSYTGLSMASFRGSSELEFGADSAYILETLDGVSVLRSEKARYGKRTDIHLRFGGAHQRFDAGDPLDRFDAASNDTKPKARR